MRVRAASISTLVLFALALLLSACGSSVKSTLDPVAAAAETTSTQKTMSLSMTMTEKMPVLPAPITMTAEGATNLSEHRASLSLDLSQLASLAGSTPSDWKMDEVMDGLVVYMRAPFLQTSLKLDKPWVKMNLESIGKQMEFDFSAFTSYNPNQTTQYLDYLRGGKGAKALGHELIRAVATTHYQVTVDFNQYVDRLPADKRAAAKKSIDNLRKLAHPQYKPFDVWIDAQNRVRREKLSFTQTVPNDGGEMSMTMDIEFFDFNKPVSVTIPPADQTVGLMKLAGSVGQG
jgi:hypothetical protein